MMEEIIVERKKEVQYIRVYTLRDKSTRSIKVETWRTFKDEMNILGIKESDIFQIQLITKKIT